MKTYRIPSTCSPFVNTPLIPAGCIPDTREPRYWCSTWNSNDGCVGALVTPSGSSHIYRFEKLPGSYCAGSGFYSACIVDPDTLWLSGDAAHLARLTLSTGAVEWFDTGAPGSLVFAGMQYDPATGKLCYSTFTPPCETTVMFDTRACRTKRIVENAGNWSTSHIGFPNGDGTYSVGFCDMPTHTTTLFCWNPADDSFTQRIAVSSDPHSKVLIDARGLVYLPGAGWYDGRRNALVDGPRPSEEKTWFVGDQDAAFGADATGIYRWDYATGSVTRLFTVPDGSSIMTERLPNGGFLSLTIYGELLRFDVDGSLLLKRKLNSDAVGATDCLLRLPNGDLLGTPFITQRFWVIDAATGVGRDLGRASPGGGEVLQVWTSGGKAYMASYTEGVLTEYDPALGGSFPENPRVVAAPPESMRPVCAAQDGTRLFYISNHHYGLLGCEATRYDTATGEAFYRRDLFCKHAVRSLFFDPALHLLLGGTTYEADCGTAVPQSDENYLFLMHPDTLEITEKLVLPSGTRRADVLGPLSGTIYAVLLHIPDGYRLAAVDAANLSHGLLLTADYPHGIGEARYTGRPGYFLARESGRLSLYHAGLDELSFVKTVYNGHFTRFFCDSAYAYVLTPREIHEVPIF
ncbi:MAG: hypothetical protein VB111_06730 [Clostridiaceae bacterium]|nr:hypothetical protein [Clostridiaceae bacterium]